MIDDPNYCLFKIMNLCDRYVNKDLSKDDLEKIIEIINMYLLSMKQCFK